MDLQDFFNIINKYTKSIQKEEAKRYKIEDPSLILKNLFVLFPTPPGEINSRNSQLLLQSANIQESSSSLVPLEIELNVKSIIPSLPSPPIQSTLSTSSGSSQNEQFLNSYPLSSSCINHTIMKKRNNLPHPSVLLPNGIVREKIFWDVSQSENKIIQQNSYHLLKDIIKEFNLLDIQEHQIQEFWKQIYTQIMDQLKDRRILLESSKSLTSFNYSEMASIQKEHLIRIPILLKNKEGKIIYKECIEWDIISEINSAESFAEVLTQDIGLDGCFVSEIAKQIRDSITAYLNRRAEQIGKFYPEFNKDSPQDSWTRAKEKEFMQKRLTFIQNEDVCQIPESYETEQLPKFENQEMFHLLKNNLDVMPPQFQERLQSIDKIEQANKSNKLGDSPFINIEKAMSVLASHDNILNNNPYVPSILKGYISSVEEECQQQEEKKKNQYSKLEEQLEDQKEKVLQLQNSLQIALDQLAVYQKQDKEVQKLEQEKKEIADDLQNRTIYDNESFQEFQNKLLKSRQDLEEKIELEQQLEICLSRLVNEGELELMDLSNPNIRNNLAKIQDQFKEFHEFKKRFGSKHEEELARIAKQYKSNLLVKEQQIKELQKFKDMVQRPVLNSEENRDPLNCTKLKIQQREVSERRDSGRFSQLSNGGKDEQLEYQLLEIETLKAEKIQLEKENEQLKQEIQENEEDQQRMMLEQRRKNNELKNMNLEINELKQNNLNTSGNAIPSSAHNLSQSNLDVSKMKSDLLQKDKLIQQHQSQQQIQHDASIKISLKTLFPTYIDSLINSKDKRISVENDQYLILIMNMLGFVDKEKNDLKQKIDKIKSQKGGFLGIFK